MQEPAVTVAVEAGIATLSIDRPRVMNALSGGAIREMRAALATLRGHQDVRVLVLTGKGRAFCTGADLSDPEIALDGDLADRPKKLESLMRGEINPLMREIQEFPRPTIAAVNGPAVGGGIGIALSADIVFAAQSAYFMQVFTPKLGLVPDMGVTWHLERLVGRARARALAMLGDRITASQAADWGLVWKCVPDEAFGTEIAETAARLAATPPLAVAKLRGLLDEAADASFADQLERELVTQCHLVGTADAQEAVAAFREKRTPMFTGS